MNFVYTHSIHSRGFIITSLAVIVKVPRGLDFLNHCVYVQKEESSMAAWIKYTRRLTRKFEVRFG